jgi:hypothetical protein
MQICIHECRITAEDEIFVATLAPKKSLQLLDLSILLKESNVTEFESLDMAIHMLFFAGKHSYKITREIAKEVHKAGIDGIIYPSYFSNLEMGTEFLPTVYGLSKRIIPKVQDYDQNKIIQNIALFGHPINKGIIEVHTINRLILEKVKYNFYLGPSF